MRKGTMKIVSVIILYVGVFMTVSSQSPYAMFGDNSKMLEAEVAPIAQMHRVVIQAKDGMCYYAEFDFKKGVSSLYDLNGNAILQESISEYAKARFTTIDRHAENYYQLSPYSFCGGNPVNAIDPDGCDTLNISYGQGKWIFNDPIIANGNDVFNVTIDGETSTYTFSEGNWGERIDALNLEITDNYTLGIYHISGVERNGTGYYVTPGGETSLQVGSGKRIPEGIYPIIAPNPGAQWQQPGIGGRATNRGVRFHYGAPYPRTWTEGCFILSSDYTKRNNDIIYNMTESKNAVQNFDCMLGGSLLYPYKTRTGKNRFGSFFNKGINKNIVIKRR